MYTQSTYYVAKMSSEKSLCKVVQILFQTILFLISLSMYYSLSHSFIHGEKV